MLEEELEDAIRDERDGEEDSEYTKRRLEPKDGHSEQVKKLKMELQAMFSEIWNMSNIMIHYTDCLYRPSVARLQRDLIFVPYRRQVADNYHRIYFYDK